MPAFRRGKVAELVHALAEETRTEPFAGIVHDVAAQDLHLAADVLSPPVVDFTPRSIRTSSARVAADQLAVMGYVERHPGVWIHQSDLTKEIGLPARRAGYALQRLALAGELSSEKRNDGRRYFCRHEKSEAGE